MKLDGSVAVITGGAGAIGKATAVALAGAGADIVIADVDEEGSLEAVRAVEATGRRAVSIPTDVGQRDAVESLVERSIGWQGHLDLFMTNAGIATSGAPQEFSVADWEAVLGVNLYAGIWAMRSVLPHMLKRQSGHLVFVSSGAGLQGQPYSAPYAVSKFGLVGLAESLAKYLKGTGVGVSLVLPGAIGGQRGDGMRTRYARVAHLSPEEIEDRRQQQRTRSRAWPRPETMAATIVDGIREGRFHVFQEGEGEHADWGQRLLRAKADDPDGSVLNG